MWTEIPREEIINKTTEGLRGRGVSVDFLKNRAEALQRLKELIPPGTELTTGASVTLNEIGFIDLLASGDHPWNNLKAKIVAEKDL
jgi:L-lactate utilization protein LutB